MNAGLQHAALCCALPLAAACASSPETKAPSTSSVEASAELPRFFESPIRFHLGFFIALVVAALVYWFLFKTKWGFDLRTVGANPRAARYARLCRTLD